MLNWISELKHRRLLRAARREKELAQVMCLHEYEYCGNYREEYYTGVDVDFYTSHRAQCDHCGKSVENSDYRTLAVMCKLKEESE